MSRDLRLLQADVIAFSSRVNAMASILRIMIDNIDVMLALQAAMMQGNTPPPPPSPTTTPLALGPAPRFLTIDGRKTLTRKASARCLQAGLVAEDVSISILLYIVRIITGCH